jgi:GNAT superfamily N-acetyltransferase
VEIEYHWRGRVSDLEMLDLVNSHGGRAVPGWWPKVREHSLGWVTARDGAGQLVGFVNVAWDGGDHAFLLDTKTRPNVQRRGIGTALVELAATRARQAGCEWLHVDFTEDLRPFYIDSGGFSPAPAGLMHLPRQRGRGPSRPHTPSP